MKYFLISFLLIFLISTKSNSDELGSAVNNRTSFETLKTMLHDIDERLSKLEEKFQKEEKQLQGSDSDNALVNGTMAKVNKRFTRIEKIISVLDLKEIKETLKSFEGTLDVFKIRLSELSKRIEDSEINDAVVEKMYRKTLEYVESQMAITKEKESVAIDKKPSDTTVSKAKEEHFQIMRKDSGDIAKEESIEEFSKSKSSKELTELTESRESRELKELKELKGLRTPIEPKALTKSKVSKNIGNEFSVSNVTFEKYGSSSIIKGEIKNNSRNDITTVSFLLKLFGENKSVIAEFDFNIMNIKSNSVKLFEQMISGVLPSHISRYKITFKKSR